MRSQYRNEARRMTRCAALVLAIFLCAACVIVAAIPFQVDLQAEYNTVQGGVTLRDDLGNENSISDETRVRIAPGETVRVEGGSSLTIEILEDSGAYADLYGPAEWTLVSAWREATVIEHMRSAAKTYEVVIEQTTGTATYNFSQANLTPEDIQLVLRFPDGEFRPRMNCFQATALAGDVPSAVVELPCGAEATPVPTLPPLQ